MIFVFLIPFLNPLFAKYLLISSSLQACVADVLVGSSSSFIRLYSIEEKILVDNTLYIQTPCVVGKLAIYHSPSLQVSSLFPKVPPSLLQATRSVEVWSSLLPRLISLSPSEIKSWLSRSSLTLRHRSRATLLFLPLLVILFLPL